MSHAKYILAAFIPALACVACGETGTSEVPSVHGAAEELASIPEKSHLAGTYERANLEISELAQLVLKTDLTYHAGKVVACFAPPCTPVVEDGWYRLSNVNRQNYITLHNSRGNMVGAYQYELRETTLALRRVTLSATADTAEGRWFSMLRSTTAWCAVASDCEFQNLPDGPCAGQWICEPSVCNYSCLPVSAR